MNKNERTKRFYLTDYDERIRERFSTTKDVENDTIYCQICAVYGYTADDCMILPAERNDRSEFPNIDEFIDLY